MKATKGWVIATNEKKQDFKNHVTRTELERKPYNSPQGRRDITRMMCVKWGVDNVRNFISILPDVK